MVSKRHYEKPVSVAISSAGTAYGQEVDAYGLCSGGAAPATCNAGSTYTSGCLSGSVVTLYCRTGVGVNDPSCSGGSGPYYGDTCAPGGTHSNCSVGSTK